MNIHDVALMILNGLVSKEGAPRRGEGETFVRSAYALARTFMEEIDRWNQEEQLAKISRATRPIASEETP